MQLIKIWGWRTTVILLCLMILGLSLAARSSGFVPGDFRGFALNQPLEVWQIPAPDTYIKLAEIELKNKNLEKAKALTTQALRNDITSGRATSQLLLAYEQLEQIETADELAKLSDHLWPAHIYTRSQLADYWVRRNELKEVLAEWNILLTHLPALRKQIYPSLLQIIEQTNTLAFLDPYINDPPQWWNSFFGYFVAQEKNNDLIAALYQARVDSPVLLDPSERRAYVQHLLKNQQWDEAYLAWLSGLNEQELAVANLLYDGGFETTTYNTGFDWRFAKTNAIKIALSATSGMQGKQALHLSLDGKDRINFQHISQLLKLNPGSYQLQYLSRIDRFNNSKGLCWRVRCHPNNSIILGEDQPLNKRSPWLEKKFSFTISNQLECPLQLLRLETCSKYPHDHLFEGSVWFDAMEIRKSTDNAIEKDIE